MNPDFAIEREGRRVIAENNAAVMKMATTKFLSFFS